MDEDIIARAIAHVAARSEGPPLARPFSITLNFHPDAPQGGRTVIERLAEEGLYRSQFETGTSNGGLTAHDGGDRWRWESRIFGQAYDGAPPRLRPKYGALNYLELDIGGSPRFGSSHLRLKPHMLARATFCYPDSFLDPADFGVAARMSLIALAEGRGASPDPLDHYIEAHVHGPLSLADDVEAVVLDPSYRGTPIEAMAASLPCRTEWHSGFRMAVSRLADCASYRGRDIAELAGSIAVAGFVTPFEIGRHRGSADLSQLKRVWHCVARFGNSQLQQSRQDFLRDGTTAP